MDTAAGKKLEGRWYRNTSTVNSEPSEPEIEVQLVVVQSEICCCFLRLQLRVVISCWGFQ
jgi:hypothetical protein